MRWREAVTLQFVKIYLKHECLWNTGLPDYKLKYVRDKAYADIRSEFNACTMKKLSVAEVKIKIKNLRTTYVQQLHKIMLKSSPDSIYEPSLVWFHEMDQCLKNLPSNRQPITNTIHQASEVDSSSHIWVEQDINGDTPIPDPLIPISDNEYDPDQSEASIKLERHSPVPYKKIKKKKIKHRTPDSKLSVSMKDEFDLYGKFIATQLRQLGLQRALRLQLEIQTLVSEARISDLSS